MDINTFSEQIRARIKTVVESTMTEQDVIRQGKMLSNMRTFIADLKQYTLSYTFKDAMEEIQFFKEVKPTILSQYFYYKRIYNLVLFDSFRDRKSRLDNYHHLLQKMRSFAHKHEMFYEYCMAGATYLDDHYFRRHAQSSTSVHDDEKFTTGYDKVLARILANEMIKEYLLKAINREQEHRASDQLPGIPWTASKVALVELIYALHTAKAFNYGKSDIRQITQCFEQLLGIDLTNHARIFGDIKLRKSGHTVFLDQLRGDLINTINDSL
ncbi:MAG: RteC domain-containing protein [Cyclobacteriaceae bacterium]|nr:RteC domain-containing protein [Cyclobacteriaceae bacterium]